MGKTMNGYERQDHNTLATPWLDALAILVGALVAILWKIA
jgi:hypothetical protein